jgi:16S rRNA (cytidine1402-2'-O)-methyltransferase
MFYVISTPIGNLEDITLRALRVLKEVDLILCEDTRVTKKLLSHYQITTPVFSYHQHTKLKKQERILEEIKKEKDLALVSDSGTPGISDPGEKLVNYLSSQIPGLKIVSIPGPSAVTAALSISGLSADKFIFLGFPPAKKKRKKFFQEAFSSKYTAVFYESPHRILKTLNDLSSELQVTGYKLQIVVCREMTKKFESVYRGGADEVIEQIKDDEIKGEFVIVLRNTKSVRIYENKNSANKK